MQQTAENCLKPGDALGLYFAAIVSLERNVGRVEIAAVRCRRATRFSRHISKAGVRIKVIGVANASPPAIAEASCTQNCEDGAL